MAVLYRISSTPNTGSAYILNEALSYAQLDGNFAYLLTNMSGSDVTITGPTSIVSGSLSVDGGITGNLSGTASYASFAGTASYFSGSVTNAVSASYALTASYFSGSVTNAVSASYALTASYALNVPTSSISASYAVSASEATLAQTSSYGVKAISSSYALTASYIQGLNLTTYQISTGSVSASVNVSTSSLFLIQSASLQFVNIAPDSSVVIDSNLFIIKGFTSQQPVLTVSGSIINIATHSLAPTGSTIAGNIYFTSGAMFIGLE